MSVIRSWWLLSAVVGFGVVSSGCASGSSGGQAIRPQSLGPPGTCYFVTSAAECILCSTRSTVTLLSSTNFFAAETYGTSFGSSVRQSKVL